MDSAIIQQSTPIRDSSRSSVLPLKRALSDDDDDDDVGFLFKRKPGERSVHQDNFEESLPLDPIDDSFSPVNDSKNETEIVSFNNTRINSEGNVVTYALCAHNTCKSFKIICTRTSKETTIALYSSGLNFNHKPGAKLTRQVRNVERSFHGDNLKKTTPDVYRRELIAKTSAAKVQAGHLDKIKSLKTIEKISSEQKSKDDLDRDDYLDIRAMKLQTVVKQIGKREKEMPEFSYIHLLIEVPFTVHLYDKEQVEIVRILKNFPVHPITVHIDATGSVVRKTRDSSKRVLYYALVMNIPEAIKHDEKWAQLGEGHSGTVIPICEMITADHRTESMHCWLSAFKFFVRGPCELAWPPFDNIVSDMSFAFLNAVAMAWNDYNSIFDYLNMCHKVLTTKEELRDSDVIINLCCSHYMKIIVSHVSAHYEDNKRDPKRAFLICSIALLFNYSRYDEVLLWFQKFVVLLCSTTENKEYHEAHIFFSQLASSRPQEYSEEELAQVQQMLPDERAEYVEHKKSAMFMEFSTLASNVRDRVANNDSGSVPNKYFNPIFLESFILKHIPFLPLFTPLMLAKRGVCCRQSNANIESFFGIVKNYIHTGSQPDKCSRFFKKMRYRILNEYKTIKLKIPSVQCNRQVKDTKRKIHSKEGWNKKRKPRFCKPLAFESFILKSSKTLMGSQDLSSNKDLVNQSEEVIESQFIDNVLNVSPEDNSDINTTDPAIRSEQVDVGHKHSSDNHQQIEAESFQNDNSDNDTTDPPIRSEQVDVGHKHSSDNHQQIETVFIHDSPPRQFPVEHLECDLIPSVKLKINPRNNTIRNIDYYKPLYDHRRRMRKYFIATVKGNKIFSTTVESLFPNWSTDRYIDDTVIDVVLHNLSEEVQSAPVSTIPCTLASCLFLQDRTHRLRPSKTSIDQFLASKVKSLLFCGLTQYTDNCHFEQYWFIPMNVNRNHWCLAFLDFKERKFVYLDSLFVNDAQKTILEGRKVMETVLGVIDHQMKKAIKAGKDITYQLDSKKWTIDAHFLIPFLAKLPVQQDDYNCGAFTCYYASQLLNRFFNVKPCFTQTNMDKLRPKLFQNILEHSDDVMNFCNICGIDYKTQSTIQCCRCAKHIHLDCLTEDEKLEVSIMDSINKIVFSCALCKVFHK
ncbi:hypothetical protein M8J76_010587 [Diaphorina citri]|nr:hypothetical protein M8J75_007724 [Diaphorina citri]KAI5709128.1 hypothetical protein M8J76_010913 [Diaphorina citri]KAI5716683.1 hypothetical protein M8J76_010587 [Diaphorina citri]